MKKYTVDDIRSLLINKFDNELYDFSNISYDGKYVYNIFCKEHNFIDKRKRENLVSTDQTPCTRCNIKIGADLKRKHWGGVPDPRDQMFLDNKYTKWYFSLMNKLQPLYEERTRLRRKKQAYFENHHIIPKCFGGHHMKENRVQLTYKEHYIAHWLLTKAVSEKYRNAMSRALVSMQSNNKLGERNIPSWMYDKFRNIRRINNSGKLNPNYGNKYSEETKRKLSEIRKGKYVGELNPMYGKTRTQEVKDAISRANSGKKHTPETIEKRKLTKKLNGNDGPLTEEHKAKAKVAKAKSIEEFVNNSTDEEFFLHLSKFNPYDSTGRKNCRLMSYIRKRGWDPDETFSKIVTIRLFNGW